MRGLLLSLCLAVGAQASPLDDALGAAIENGRHDAAKSLLAQGANPDASLNFQRRDTPLLLAAERGNLRLVRLLLSHGARVDGRRGDWGETPLISAAMGCRVAALRELIAKGADVNARSRGQDMEGAERYGRSALMWTAEKGCLDASRLLLERCADPDLRNEHDNDIRWDGATALFYAAEKGRLPVVRLLLEHGADPRASNARGDTPYLLAARNGHVQVMRLLETAQARGKRLPAAKARRCAYDDLGNTRAARSGTTGRRSPQGRAPRSRRHDDRDIPGRDAGRRAVAHGFERRCRAISARAPPGHRTYSRSRAEGAV